MHPEADARWRLDIKDRAPVIANFVVGADGIESKVRRRLTSVQPAYTGVDMIAANIHKDLWRDSEIDRLLGEGSVMCAVGGKTVFTQRCNHDLTLLYISLVAAVAAFEARMQQRTSKETGACSATGQQRYGFDLDYGSRAAA